MADSRGSRPNNLPIPLTTFVGRTQEIAEVKRLLARTRFLTVTGTGGCGKTRLALQVAAELCADYADGVWITDLAALSDPAFVPHNVALALSVPEQPGRQLVDSLVDALRPKSLLLLLDNCEHLLTACGQLVDALLRRCPNLRVLATSRERLGIAGELTYRVPSLSVPPPGRLLSPEEVARYEAVCLFIERAAVSDSEFRITSRNLPAVVQVCSRLDGIPLAIELAAARVPALSVDQIAARLDDRFGLLTGGSRAALPRQQTLGATMDWSYDLLSGKERSLLRRLSVFAGGCMLEAVEAVCAGGGLKPAEILDLLSQLIDKSLVQVESREGEARYRLLETVREYGRTRLPEAGEAEETRRRHRDWCLTLAERAEPELRGPNQLAWFQQLEENHDNLRAALESSGTEAGEDPAGLRLAAALSDFWDIHNHFAEGRAWLDRMLSLHGDAPPTLRVKALTRAAHLAHRQGDYAQVPTLCEEALALSRAGANKEGNAEALHYLAHAAEAAGDHRRAAELLEESVALHRAAASTWELARTLSCLANTARAGANYPRAVALYEEALRLFRPLGDKGQSGVSSHNLGYAVLRYGDRHRSRALFRESLAAAEERGDRRMVLKCLAGLAGASADDRPEWAARLFGAADALMSAAGYRLESFNRRDWDHYLAVAKDRIGERAFGAAWARGAALTLEQAMAYALAVEKVAAPAGATGNTLTSREREVTSLIARGLTNRAIASHLVIAERTVDTHVEHILNKLGFTSRTQIAAWAVEQGLHKPASG